VKISRSQLAQIIKEELGAVKEDCWDGYVRNYDVPKGAPGSCRKKGSANEALEDRINPDLDDLEQAGFRPDPEEVGRLLAKKFPDLANGRVTKKIGKNDLMVFIAEEYDTSEQTAMQVVEEMIEEGIIGMYDDFVNIITADFDEVNESIEKMVREELEAVIDEKKRKKKKKKKKKKRDACYHKVKSRYDVWPSAYASGALVKCRKVGAKNWGKSTTKEELALYEGKESLEAKIRNALIEEGGAAGMKALKDHTEASEKQIKDAIKGMKDVGLHEDGDYILQDSDEIRVKKTIDEENLNQWFKQGGWKQAGGKYDGEPCARQPGQKTTPKCVSPSKHSSMTKKQRDNAARRKRKKDPNQPKKTGAAKPTNVKTDPQKGGRKKKKEGMEMNKQRLMEIINEELEDVLYYEMLAEGETLEEAEYQGRKVKLNKPTRGDVKKSKVYVKNAKGNVVKVNFGDKNMKIKKSNPKRRKSFRARHNCKNPGPKWKARYWSCKAW
jgi:hypothetical protein